MTSQELEAMTAAFLAKGGAVTRADDGIAYGVDKDADKAKRAANREAERVEREAEASECAAERYAESIREAYHTGGRHAAIDAMQPRRVRLYRY